MKPQDLVERMKVVQTFVTDYHADTASTDIVKTLKCCDCGSCWIFGKNILRTCHIDVEQFLTLVDF